MLLQNGAAFLCYKAGKVMLQCRAGIIRWSNFIIVNLRDL